MGIYSSLETWIIMGVEDFRGGSRSENYQDFYSKLPHDVILTLTEWFSNLSEQPNRKIQN